MTAPLTPVLDQPVTVIASGLIDPADVPPTPTTLEEAAQRAPDISQRLLDAVGQLGIPVGYPREQGGRIIHDLFPIRSNAHRQISSSSLVDLGMHTETAFHPYRPDFVVLLCLRGDPAAHTTHASIDEILARLDADVIETLHEPRFITTVDESFMSLGEGDHEFITAPLSTDHGTTRLIFDEQLMRGTDPTSTAALGELSKAITNCVRSTVLSAGDLLVIDNHRAVHGRSHFTPRFDGTDRWLRRALVLREAPPSSDFDGRLVTTAF